MSNSVNLFELIGVAIISSCIGLLLDLISVPSVPRATVRIIGLH